jgi:LacI family transcriptional regulator
MKKRALKSLTGVKEIARRANVSIATVDRVIHDRIGVSEKKKIQIKKIIKELDYKPNLFAQRLASKKVIKLATLIPKGSGETSFWEAPLNGILQAANEINKLGVTVQQFFYDQNIRESFVEASKKLLKSIPDGILLAPTFIEESVIFTEKCKTKGIPYVLIDSDLPNQGSLCYIGPDLFHSGYLNAHLVNYLIKPNEKILIVNISNEIDNQHHLVKKEEGFRSYFEDRKQKANIIKIDIKKTDYKSIEKELNKLMTIHNDIKLIFVTNSRVFDVARFVESKNKSVLLVGYDFISKNIEYLEKEVIDFLICQKPQEQAYKGIMSLYQHLSEKVVTDNVYFMPIDIITKENYHFYRN